MEGSIRERGVNSVNSLSLWPLLITLSLINPDITIHDKIVETLSSNGVASENKTINIHPHPLPTLLHSKLGCCFVSYSCTGASNSSTTFHRGGGGGKASFSLFEGHKTTQRAFRAKSVSTTFLALIAV